jgi:hypothetical protein
MAGTQRRPPSRRTAPEPDQTPVPDVGDTSAPAQVEAPELPKGVSYGDTSAETPVQDYPPRPYAEAITEEHAAELARLGKSPEDEDA